MLSNSLNQKIIKLVCLVFLLMSCSPSKSEGFAIYLTKNNILPADMESLSYVEPQENPLISIEDIVSYNTQSHEIVLTDSAYERILQFEVTVRGTSFLVCID